MQITLDTYADKVSVFCSKLPIEYHNIHMSLGIADEMFELLNAISKNDVTNIIEECGDLCWFISQYCKQNNIVFSDVYNTAKTATKGTVFTELSPGIINITKAIVAKYNKTFTEKDIFNALVDNVSPVIATINAYNLNIEDVLTKNYEKLSSRYNKNRFDANDAAIRDLNKEREILEK